MCLAIIYKNQYAKLVKIYFPNSSARLPVLQWGGDNKLVAWGRRSCQPGNLPLGGWVKLTDIYGGRWDSYFPKPVKVNVQQFMEKDFENRDRWFPVTEGQYLQGVLMRYDRELRVYVAVIEPQNCESEFERWPRVLSG